MMTPKEKARDLVNKFYPNVQWKLGQEDCLDRAKRCAIIAVDEVIEQLEGYGWYKPQKTYWDAVKQEIEKL